MKLSEAIEIKETYLKGDEWVDHNEHLEADRFSIEAMKRVQQARKGHIADYGRLLPGETRE